VLLTQLVEVSCHGSEFIVVVDEENAVQFSMFSARSVLVGNQSSAAQHTLHWNRRSTQSKLNMSDRRRSVSGRNSGAVPRISVGYLQSPTHNDR